MGQGIDMVRMLLTMCLVAATAAEQDSKVTPLVTRNLSGIESKEGTRLVVEYAPGAASPAHRHNTHTFVYVLEGSVVMAVKGGNEVTLEPGQTFYEAPADVHTVSRNAGATKAARILCSS